MRLLFAALLFVAAVYLVRIYNGLVALRENVRKAWANIDVLLTQRHDELPKLVETCKRYMQYEQETLERVRVRYIPADGFSVADARSIVERLRQRMGDIEVILEATDSIPRGANGKFRAVICQLPPEERGRVTKHE